MGGPARIWGAGLASRWGVSRWGRVRQVLAGLPAQDLPRSARHTPGWDAAGSSFEALQMETLPQRKDIPPWVKVPEDLRDPEVFQLQTRLLEAILSE